MALQVSASTDDAREYANGDYNDSSDRVLLGDLNGFQDYVGFRFTNVPIPQGAIIDSATLTVVSYDNRSGNTQFMLRGEANGNPPTFSVANSPRARVPTTAGVTWPINQGWTANQAYTSPDIAALVQEIVDRPDWGSGNALVLLVWDVVVDNQRRFAATYERSPSQAAELRLTFHLTGPTATPTSTPTSTLTPTPT
ncbi:MAG: hypothetical protein FJZ89_12030, partial [Chloroflexi bacterium]|nr:hypothetical protein [Chloroflexota bacterium]